MYNFTFWVENKKKQKTKKLNVAMLFSVRR